MYTVDEVYWNLAASEWVRDKLTAEDQRADAVEPFGWKGQGAGSYSDIDWRHPRIEKPTETELRDTWQTFVDAETARVAAKTLKLVTMTDFVTAAATMQAQLTALIAANTADIASIASDRDVPDALKPYLTRMMQRQAAAIQAQTGAFQVAIVLAKQYADNPQALAVPE